MTNNIHGHNVLKYLIKNRSGVSMQTMDSHFKDQFGEDVTFKTCSQNGMSLDSIITMFIQNDKLQKDGENISIIHENIPYDKLS